METVRCLFWVDEIPQKFFWDLDQSRAFFLLNVDPKGCEAWHTGSHPANVRSDFQWEWSQHNKREKGEREINQCLMSWCEPYFPQYFIPLLALDFLIKWANKFLLYLNWFGLYFVPLVTKSSLKDAIEFFIWSRITPSHQKELTDKNNLEGWSSSWPRSCSVLIL